MERYQMAEALRQKAGISYEEARKALEDSNWDMLDAMVHLERGGKVGAGQGKEKEAMGSDKVKQAAQTAEGWFTKFIGWVKSVIDAGNQSHFTITKEGRQVLEVPVTVAVLLFLFLHGVFVFALVLALIFGYRFAFRGRKEAEADRQAVREAEEAAEQIRQQHAVNSLGDQG